jgi:preprotein translocase subunit YajC
VLKRSDKKWYEEIPEDRRLNVGDRVKNIADFEGTVLEVSEEHLGIQSVCVRFDVQDRWQLTENLEKV